MSLGQGFCQRNFSHEVGFRMKNVLAKSSAWKLITTGQMDTSIAGLMYKCWDIVFFVIVIIYI